MFDDTKQRAASLRQLSFLWPKSQGHYDVLAPLTQGRQYIVVARTVFGHLLWAALLVELGRRSPHTIVRAEFMASLVASKSGSKVRNFYQSEWHHRGAESRQPTYGQSTSNMYHDGQCQVRKKYRRCAIFSSNKIHVNTEFWSEDNVGIFKNNYHAKLMSKQSRVHEFPNLVKWWHV